MERLRIELMVKQGDAWPIAMKVVQDWGFSVAINGSKRLLVGLVGLIGDVKRLEPMPKLDFVTSTIMKVDCRTGTKNRNVTQSVWADQSTPMMVAKVLAALVFINPACITRFGVVTDLQTQALLYGRGHQL
jgi:hypothetical protein